MDRARIAIADFLHALDRGDFGPEPLHHGLPGDRAESAHVTALREVLREPRAGAESSDHFETERAAA